MKLSASYELYCGSQNGELLARRNKVGEAILVMLYPRNSADSE